MTNPKPDVFEALFDPLPEGWRERKGLPPEPGGDREPPAPASKGRESAASAAKTAEANAAPPPRRAGAPETPWQLSRRSWLEIGKRVIKEFSADRVTSVAGGVTFFALLALFPAITALVSIYGMVADPATIADHLSLLENILPQSALDLISGQVIAIASAPKTSLSIAGIVALLVALWSANGGMKALIEALNIAWFETEKRGFIKLNLVSLTLTLSAIVGVILMIALVAVLPVLLNTILAGSRIEGILSWLRWPILAGMLILGLAVIYRFGPSKEDPTWQWISPGAVVATLGLLVASILFSWYAANFANYNETYGSLGAAVATMMWLWIAAIVVLMGAEVNSEVERQIKIENGVPPKSREDLDRA